jgi:hypothetical protein
MRHTWQITSHLITIQNYEQPLIIQDTFLGIPAAGNAIQHPVTYVHFSHFIANKTHSTNSTIMLQGSDSTQPVTVYNNNRHSGFQLY